MSHAGGTIDELLDRAVEAVNAGRLDVARELATSVLAADAANSEAAMLLAEGADTVGELRRPTIVFSDLVGSTALSGRHDPEAYRRLVGHYKAVAHRVIEDTYGGHIMSVKGDGLLALFGYPSAHEDDALRAALASVAIVDALEDLSQRTQPVLAEHLSARVALHRGLVYVDTGEAEIYGLAANVASRIHELAEPGTVVASDSVAALIADHFQLVRQPPRAVKGVDAPVTTWRVMSAAAARPQRALPSLVGRIDELAAIRAAWDARPGAVIVRGEAGIGKSCLVDTIAAELADDGATVVTVAGSALHAGADFRPLRVLLEQRCRIDRDAPALDRLAALRTDLRQGDRLDLLGPLAALLGIDESAGYEAPLTVGRALRDQVVAAVGEYVSAALAPPAILVAEDVQWFDDATIEVLSSIIRGQHEGVLVLMTSRDDDDPDGCRAQPVPLGTLDERDARALLDSVASGVLAEDVLRLLVARGDGVPLYLEELARAASQPAGDISPAGPASGSGSSIPDVLYEPLRARLDATPQASAIAALAAAFGRTFDHDLLISVAEVEATDVDAALEDLTASRIIEPVPASVARFRFRHELIRDVAYETLPPSVRRAVHERVADALRRNSDEDWADWLVLADHYRRADRPVDAITCYERAADQARRIGALRTMADRLGQGIELLASLPDSSAKVLREIELRLARAFVFVSIEGNASAVAAADYQRCLQLSLDEDSTEDVLRSLIPLWSYYTSRGELARAAELTSALRSMVDQGREWFEAENDGAFGTLHWFGGRFVEAEAMLERSSATRRRRGEEDGVTTRWILPNDPTASMMTHLGLARFARGDPAGAADAFTSAERFTSDLPFPQGPFSLAYNQTYRSWAAMHLGEFDTAVVLVDDTVRVAERHGFDLWNLAGATQQLSIAVHRACRTDDPDTAQVTMLAAQLTGVASMWRLAHLLVFLPSVLTTAALAQAVAGRRDEAGALLDEAAGIAAGLGVRFMEAERLRVAALASGDPDASVVLLERAAEVASSQGATAFLLRIANDMFVLDQSRGTPLLREAVSAFAPGAECAELDRARRCLATDVEWQDAAGGS